VYGLDLRETTTVTVRLYDASGRLVRHLLERELPLGVHTFACDPSALPSGAYMLRVDAGNALDARKLVIVQ
jgi:hypothetical protein